MTMERPTNATINRLRINYLLGDSIVGSTYAKFEGDNNLYEVLKNTSGNKFEEEVTIQMRRVEYNSEYMITREYSRIEYDVFHDRLEMLYSFADAVQYFKSFE